MKISIITLFILITGLASSNVFANTNSELTDGLSHCFKVVNNEQRLTCFDRLAQSFTQATPVTAATVSKAAKKSDTNIKPLAAPKATAPAKPVSPVKIATTKTESKTAEAKKIANVVKALVIPSRTDSKVGKA